MEKTGAGLSGWRYILKIKFTKPYGKSLSESYSVVPITRFNDVQKSMKTRKS
jgi:hypothetical protein